jgi:hypothetical protein
MTVTRIESNFFDREGMLCVIEDSEARWLARPMADETEVEVLVTSGHR